VISAAAIDRPVIQSLARKHQISRGLLLRLSFREARQ
jgi:hypothetical protein